MERLSYSIEKYPEKRVVLERDFCSQLAEVMCEFDFDAVARIFKEHNFQIALFSELSDMYGMEPGKDYEILDGRATFIWPKASYLRKFVDYSLRKMFHSIITSETKKLVFLKEKDYFIISRRTATACFELEVNVTVGTDKNIPENEIEVRPEISVKFVPYEYRTYED